MSEQFPDYRGQQPQHYPPPGPAAPGGYYPPGQQAPVKKKRRIFLWVFLAVQVLFLVWIIAGIAGNSGTATGCEGLDQATCEDAQDVGTAIGVAGLIVFWAIVDIILGVGYGVYKLAKRD